MTNYDLHQDDPVGDSLDLKYHLYPLLRHKHSNTGSTFAVSRPEQFVSWVFALNYTALTTPVSSLLDTTKVYSSTR